MSVGCKGVIDNCMYCYEWPLTLIKHVLKLTLEVIFHGFVALNSSQFPCDLWINLMVILRFNIWHSFGLPYVVFLIGTQTKNLSTILDGFIRKKYFGYSLDIIGIQKK